MGILRTISAVAALRELHGLSNALWPCVQLKPLNSVTSAPFETTRLAKPFVDVFRGDVARIIRVPMKTL